MINSYTKREQKILSIVIENYSKTGIPVGSSFISNTYFENGKHLSSATIRNEMVTMERKGLLEKPHYASGRIPSKMGYCVYVKSLKNNYKTLTSTIELEHKLNKYVSTTSDTKALLLKHLDFLSEETGFATLLLLPDFFSLKLSRMEFVRLSKNQIMAILIATSGLHKQFVIDSETSVALEDMVTVANYINKNYFGLSLYEIKKHIINRMRSNIKEMDLVSRRLLLASYSCFQAMDNEKNSNLIVKGVANLFGEGVPDISTLHKLVESFEQKKQIIDIISNCLDSDVSVIIENSFAENLSFVVSPYGIESGMKGAFGLVGPMTMDYKYIMSTMKYLAEHVIEKIIMI